MVRSVCRLWMSHREPSSNPFSKDRRPRSRCANIVVTRSGRTIELKGRVSNTVTHCPGNCSRSNRRTTLVLVWTKNERRVVFRLTPLVRITNRGPVQREVPRKARVVAVHITDAFDIHT